MLGHELRNPLAPIVTAVELLKQQGHARTREVVTIERQSQHLVRLVDDLLDIARVTRGKLELKRRVVELRVVVSKAIEMVSPLIERRQQLLQLDLPPDVYVDADEFRLAQLLSNVLSNAAKNTPDGGQIRIRARARGQQLSLEVQDTGCGIGAELLPRLFSPFVQASQGSERSLGGLGLGLAIARSLVEAHGGSISAASEGVGKGSVFRVELPIVVQGKPRTAAPEAPRDGAVSARSILVVDDNEDAAELLAHGLRQRGHRVHVALDPVEALSAVRSARPDIALLDIGLPVMDGYELAAQLRTELAGSCPPLIAITGYGQENDRRRSADAGFALHLVKPVQLDALLEAVARVAPAAAGGGL
jgi:CheY-like chemotaxis protein/two-component sensor histidine kinase